MEKREVESEAQRQGEGETWTGGDTDGHGQTDMITSPLQTQGAPLTEGPGQRPRGEAEGTLVLPRCPSALLSPEPVGTWGHGDTGRPAISGSRRWDPALPLTRRVALGQ